MFKNITIEIHFQPIILSINKTTYGVEALLRAKHNINNQTINPFNLLKAAENKNKLLELNKYLIELSVSKFNLYKNKVPLLFLNLESIFVNKHKEEKTLSYIEKICKRNFISHSKIVLEIKEDSIENNDILFSFCNKAKSMGFQIALDDFGTGSSTYERINIVSPDIIKIDKCLIQKKDDDFIKEQIVKSIIEISKNIGSTILAEGVEEESEIISCLSNGITLFQGWYFEKAKKELEKFEYFEELNKPLFKLRGIKQKELLFRSKIISTSEKFIKKVFKMKKINKLDIDDIIEETKFPLKEMLIVDYETKLQINDIYSFDKYFRTSFDETNDKFDHSFHDFFTMEYDMNEIFLSKVKMSKKYKIKIYELFKIINFDNKKIVVMIKLEAENKIFKISKDNNITFKSKNFINNVTVKEMSSE